MGANTAFFLQNPQLISALVLLIELHISQPKPPPSPKKGLCPYISKYGRITQYLGRSYPVLKLCIEQA